MLHALNSMRKVDELCPQLRNVHLQLTCHRHFRSVLRDDDFNFGKIFFMRDPINNCCIALLHHRQ